MSKKTFTLLLTVMLSVLGAKADVNPTAYASEVGEGQFYLYSVDAEKFINPTVNAPTLVDYDRAQPTMLTAVDGKYLMTGVTDKYLKLGTYNGQYLWSDGAQGDTYWTIIPVEGDYKAYQIVSYEGDYTEGAFNGTWYLKGNNAISVELIDGTEDGETPGTYVFISEDGFAQLVKAYKTIEKRQELGEVIAQAAEIGIDVTAATAVYEKKASTLEELEAAIATLRQAIAEYQENNVTPDNPRDVTAQWIPNSTFDSNFDGWVSDTNCRNNQVNTRMSDEIKNGKMEGGVWENWISSTFQGRMYRTIEGLPNGVYMFQVDAFAYNPVNQYVYANNARTTITSNVAETYQVFTAVTDHTLECGLLAADYSNGWLGMDNVKLIYYGASADSYKYWVSECKKLLETLAGVTYTDSYMDAYLNILAEAEASNSPEEIAAIMVRAQECLEELYTNIAAYDKIENLRDEIMNIVSSVNTYYGGILGDDEMLLAETADDRTMTTEQLNTLYDEVNARLEEAKRSITLLEELNDAVDLLEQTIEEYAATCTPEALAKAKQVKNDGISASANDELTNEEAEQMIAAINEAIAALKVPGGVATDDNPLDYTSYIVNPSYDNNDNKGWSGTNAGRAQSVKAAECWNKNFDIYQNIANLPEGVYTIGLQAFYRAGWNTEDVYNAWKDGSQPVNFYIYAETGEGRYEKTVKSIWQDARDEGEYGAIGAGSETLVYTMYVPNDMTAAVAYFEDGRYKNELTVRVTDGNLKIGIYKDELVKEDWSMFDNWTLTYYGPDSQRETTPTGIESIQGSSSTDHGYIYDLQGRRHPSMQRGLNIVRRADGSTVKVLVK